MYFITSGRFCIYRQETGLNFKYMAVGIKNKQKQGGTCRTSVQPLDL